MNTQRITQLLNTIKEHNEAYRIGKPIVSDTQYDKEVSELKSLDPNNDWFKHIEPTLVSKGRKVKLPIPMKSLNKTKTLSELKQWISSLNLPTHTKLVIMPKYDGVSWLHDEMLNKTYSRGGAENEGQDCSSHFVKGKFYQKSDTSTFPARYTFGELVFSRQSWSSKMLGRKSDVSGEPYKSPRNTVAGFINRDEAPDDIQYANFVRYGVDESSLQKWETFSELLDSISNEFKQDKSICPFEIISIQNLSEDVLLSLFYEWQRNFYIDGLVVYIDDLSLWRTIGRQQTTGNPLYAIAYKSPDFTESFETTVKDIEWKISKAGALKPVVNIESVDTGYCTMENPTGYNARFIFDNKIGKGTKIIVTRSGGVIPKILSVVKGASTEEMSKQMERLCLCPDCGEPIIWNESHIELVCTNKDCPGIRFAKIVHFYKTLDAEQMGEETLARIFNARYNTLSRILNISFNELLRIEGFGETTANIIIDTNKRIREGVEITKLMHASDCFAGIGQIKARKILSEMSDCSVFAIVNGYVQPQPEIIGTQRFNQLSKTTQSFISGLPLFYNFVATNKLKILPMEEEIPQVGDKYIGMKVCFTGIRDKDLERAIVSQGGEVINTVSKKTTHLIVADLNSTSTKMSKAKSLNIPIFTIESFKQL